MLKLFGLRITPFFFFILAMECTALLTSLYLGVLLFKGTTGYVSYASMDSILYSATFLLMVITLITPGFFSQVTVISHLKKTLKDKSLGIISASIAMTVIVFANLGNLDTKTLFAAAVLSGCIGLSTTQVELFGRYWRFLVRSGVN